MTAAQARIADGHDDFPRTLEIALGEVPAGARTTASIRAAIESPWFTKIPARTPGQEWRRKRDLTIYWLADRGRFSQRFLADVFDLPRSRVGDIVQTMKDLECSS